jgi:hypothetical protein
MGRSVGGGLLGSGLVREEAGRIRRRSRMLEDG